MIIVLRKPIIINSSGRRSASETPDKGGKAVGRERKSKTVRSFELSASNIQIMAQACLQLSRR